MNPELAQIAARQTRPALPLPRHWEQTRHGLSLLMAERPASTQRSGQMLPIAAILPDLLRRYDLPL